MTEGEVRQGGEEIRGVVDASGGNFYDLKHSPVVVGVASERDPDTGLPRVTDAGVGHVDPRCLRFHDLDRVVGSKVQDRRLAVQMFVDYRASYTDPREADPAAGVPEDAPFGQPENFTSLNRTTRWADSADRVALPTSMFRLIGSEDQRDAVAVAYRGPVSPEASPVDTFDDSDLPEGVHIDEAGAIDPTGANAGGAVLKDTRVLIDPGLSFFGGAAAETARRIAREGGTKRDIANALSAQARGLEPPPRETQERKPKPPPPPTKPAGSVTPANHPLGYVWDETSERIGLLGTLVQAGAIEEQYFFGREGNPINRLAIRSDAHFALNEAHTGALMLKPGDAALIPDNLDGNPVKGVLLFDTSVANQDTEVGQEKGKWRPVVWIKAQDIKPPPPPQPPPYVEPPRVQPPPPAVPPSTPGGTTTAGPDPGDTGISPWIGLLPDPSTGGRNVVSSGVPGPATSSTTVGTTGHPGVTAQGGWLVVGGQKDGEGVVQGGVSVEVPDGYQPAEGNVATVPVPTLGSPEAPDLATWAAWISYLLGSQQVMALGLLGGGSYVQASLGAISTGPTSQGSVIGEAGTAPAGTTRTAGPALEVTSTLVAEDGGEWVSEKDPKGVQTITRGKPTGSVRDSRPMVLIDDQAGTGDLIATTGGEFGVTSDGSISTEGSVSASGWSVADGVQTLTGLADDPSVSVPDGQAMLYFTSDGTLKKRVGDTSTEVGSGVGSIALDDLTDVDTSGVAASATLAYEGGVWIATNDPTFDSLNIVGKLTVGGMIDPTGLQLTVQASNPGGLGLDGTIWWDGDFLQVGDGGTVDIKVGYNDWARNTSATAGADYVRKLYRRLDTGSPADGIAGLVGYYVDRTAAGADTALGGFYFGWDSVSTPSGYYRWTLPTSANGTELRLSDATKSLLVTGSAGGQLFLGAVTSTPTAPAASVGAIYTKDGSDLFFQSPGGVETDLLAGGTSPPVADTTAVVKGSADATKLLRFEVDGLTTATTRVLTAPDLDGTIATVDGGQTFSSATWQGTAVGATYGGTAQTSWTTGDMLYASGANTLAKLAAGTNGHVLTLSGGVPTWAAASSGNEFADNVFRVYDNGNTSRKLAFELSGLSATTRTWTIPDLSGTVVLREGSNTFTAAQNVQVSDAGTNTSTKLLDLIHVTSGTAAAAFGGHVGFGLENAASTQKDAAEVGIEWSDATGGSEDADFVVRLMAGGAAAAEKFRVTSAGQVTTGTWSATAIGPTKGGTGQTTVAAGDLLYGSASDAWSRLAAGSDGDVLTLASGVPSWAAPAAQSHATLYVDTTGGTGTTGSSYTLPANTLGNNSESLEIEASGTGDGVSADRVVLTFGATTLLSVATGGGAWWLRGTLTRLGASSQEFSGVLIGASIGRVNAAAAAIDLTANAALKVAYAVNDADDRVDFFRVAWRAAP